jgi:hypothetical protein
LSQGRKNQFKGDDDKSRNRFRVLWKYNLKKIIADLFKSVVEMTGCPWGKIRQSSAPPCTTDNNEASKSKRSKIKANEVKDTICH